MSEELQPLKRCAIYTRKSTNHLLDREINSLTTQQEICRAYINSQQYRGWVELPRSYDDGGHSGSRLERPALARLMADIEVGEVDVIVVYKIDRLTRSLLDFVRLIEVFDRQSISLVSISQAFDTSDSMGRMILNVLLTFSQFERELISERIRDSIRTRKRHGRTHGGLPPFGYVRVSGELKIDEPEAKIVRFIFSEFLRTERYTAVMTAVRDADLRRSIKHTRHGVERGATPIGAGTVYSMLRNPIYSGQVQGHDQLYPGQHEAIISMDTWDAAIRISEDRARKPPNAKGTHHFLAGLLHDDLGRHMLLDVLWYKGEPSFHYASSNASWSQVEYLRAYRTRADRLERLVLAAVSAFLCDRRKLRAALKGLGVVGEELTRLAVSGGFAAANLEASPPEWMKELIAALLIEIEVGEEHLSLCFRSIELRRFLEWNGKTPFRGRPDDWPCSDARYVLDVGVNAISTERIPALHLAPRDPLSSCMPDRLMVALIDKARKAQRLVDAHRDRPVEELAKEMRCKPAHFARLVRLNFLAPDIVTAILDGTQPTTLTRDDLMWAHLPTDWAVQRKLFGFAKPRRALSPRNLYGRGMWPPHAQLGEAPTEALI